VLIRLELDAEPPLLDLLAYLVDVPGQVEEFIDVVLLFVPGSKITIEVGRLGYVASFDTPVDRALQVAPLSGNLLSCHRPEDDRVPIGLDELGIGCP